MKSQTSKLNRVTPTFEEWLEKYFTDKKQTITYVMKGTKVRYSIEEIYKRYKVAYKSSLRDEV